MHMHIRTARAMVTFVAVSCAFGAKRADAQGCEPIRFTTPVTLGGEGQAYQPAHEWQLTLAYRRLVSSDFFAGTRQVVDPAMLPNGRSPIFRIHTMVADVAYSIDDRFRVSASLPFSKGSFEVLAPDKTPREQHANGIGDLSIMGEGWILEPRSHERGNFALAVGVKAPTGSHTMPGPAASGEIASPASQTIQPSDGGWALLMQTRAFRQITDRIHAYAFGSYMVSTKAQSDVEGGPGSGVYWSVPDVYSARLGGAISVLPDYGVTLSLGGRIDGIPVRNLISGGDANTIKHSAYVVFADPGLSVSVGRSTMTLSVPYRLMVNRTKSLREQRTGELNAGGFAKYLVFAAYSYRL